MTDDLIRHMARTAREVFRESECTDYGRRVSITSVRTFAATRRELGIGEDQGSWFVYDRAVGAVEWHKHVGPMSTAAAAAAWIRAIRETPA